jgi:type IV pilus modification protein PilV
MMIRSQSNTAARGFSLIEVLIAVVMLSFGLLALAALQTRLIQASAEAKAQSVAISLAKDKLEELRSYTSLAAYRALDSGSDPSTDPRLVDASGSLGGVTFTRSWTVDRYAMQLTAGVPNGTFDNSVANTGTLSPTNYAQNNEFKRVVVTVDWSDATNQNRTVRMEDAIAGLDPQDSARNSRTRTNIPRGPKVLIYDPSSETGVIPIAVGDDTSTAATNPKPVVVARTGDDAVETRFDVLTYNGLNGGLALAQSRVETTVVGCTCRNTAGTSPGYRPTYWNGVRYVPPVPATGNAPGRVATGVTQSTYCTECCRDHHDPGTETGPKFSPRRSAHTHFKLVGGVLTLAGANDDYLEACRLIRVDGIFDVAADMANDYFNLLETGSTSTSPAPSTTAVTNYQNFVLDYLNARYATPTPSAGFESATFNNRTSPAPSATAATRNLDDPAEISMPGTNATRWLHSRGLYVDYLEQDALDAIGDAKADCKGTGVNPPTATQLRDCVLRVLPFTSINLTELSEWTPRTGTQIKVTNDDFSTSINFTDPVRGKVTPGTSPTTNQVTNAVAQIGSSNSGVAISGDINTDEDDVIATDVNGYWTDSQAFRIANSGGGPSGGTFDILFGNYSINTSAPPQAGYTYASRSDVCSATGGTNPFACATQSGEALPYAITVRVGIYNKSGSDIVVNACRANKTTTMPYRTVYDVSSMTSSNGSAVVGTLVPTNNNAVGAIPSGEYTEALVTPIAQGDQITANMSAPTYLCPANYPGSGLDPQCAGNGSNAAPTWSTTFVNCPSQGAPPDLP